MLNLMPSIDTEERPATTLGGDEFWYKDSITDYGKAFMVTRADFESALAEFDSRRRRFGGR